MVICRRGAKKGQAYLKINESEIADDYPEPEQYVGVRTCLAHWHVFALTRAPLRLLAMPQPTRTHIKTWFTFMIRLS